MSELVYVPKCSECLQGVRKGVMLDDAEWYHLRCLRKVLNWKCKNCGYYTSEKDDYECCHDCGLEEWERASKKGIDKDFADSVEKPDE